LNSTLPVDTRTSRAFGQSVISISSPAMAVNLAARPSERARDRRCSKDCCRLNATWAE
jgi:hypothetical protein